LIITFFYIFILPTFNKFSLGVSQRLFFIPVFTSKNFSQKKLSLREILNFQQSFFLVGVRLQRLVFIFVWCLFLINPLITFAGNYIDVMNSMKNGNYVDAVKLFRLASDNGDNFSQHCFRSDFI
jgi:hypothetical protein